MFEIRHTGEGLVVLEGRLDANEADRAVEALGALPGPLTLDCAGLEYISSAGLGAVLHTFKRLQASGQTLRLVNLKPKVKNVFSYAGFHRLFPID